MKKNTLFSGVISPEVLVKWEAKINSFVFAGAIILFSEIRPRTGRLRLYCVFFPHKRRAENDSKSLIS